MRILCNYDKSINCSDILGEYMTDIWGWAPENHAENSTLCPRISKIYLCISIVEHIIINMKVSK